MNEFLLWMCITHVMNTVKSLRTTTKKHAHTQTSHHIVRTKLKLIEALNECVEKWQRFIAIYFIQTSKCVLRAAIEIECVIVYGTYARCLVDQLLLLFENRIKWHGCCKKSPWATEYASMWSVYKTAQERKPEKKEEDRTIFVYKKNRLKYPREQLVN